MTQWKAESLGGLREQLKYGTTPSIVYKRHAIRDTSQIFEKNKRQRLVSAIDLRDSWHTTFQETFAVTSQNWLAKRQKICWFLLHWVKKLSHFWDSSFLVWFGQTFTFASNLFNVSWEKKKTFLFIKDKRQTIKFSQKYKRKLVNRTSQKSEKIKRLN